MSWKCLCWYSANLLVGLPLRKFSHPISSCSLIVRWRERFPWTGWGARLACHSRRRWRIALLIPWWVWFSSIHVDSSSISRLNLVLALKSLHRMTCEVVSSGLLQRGQLSWSWYLHHASVCPTLHCPVRCFINHLFLPRGSLRKALSCASQCMHSSLCLGILCLLAQYS